LKALPSLPKFSSHCPADTAPENSSNTPGTHRFIAILAKLAGGNAGGSPRPLAKA
jgi:hypothetical protein